MVSKNSEAPLAATFGASIENNREGNIDMNIVARSDLNFQGKAIVPVTGMTGIWLTSAEIANALQYKSAKSVTNLFNQNSDEFTSGMTQVIESVTSGNYRKKVRVFSLRGAHLIAMLARTDVAKEFRRWVLDILDREVAHSPIAKQFTDDELCRLAWMWDVTNRMQNFARDLYPAMRTIKSEYAGKFYDFGNEFRWTFEEARKAIAKASEHIAYEPQNDDNWSRVLPRLRKELH
ncbi:P22AR C-terminal domain-containing protein [Klebsiella pneumoniae]|uniref:P22AR C-terminal domain-containing protein n=1 Tax=Klebsiella pneumoniae TaxID=573 RepID=UPI0006678BDE|nr:P22AR C-terminal domain-containing protein [Klebsiella pneumoniae]